MAPPRLSVTNEVVPACGQAVVGPMGVPMYQQQLVLPAQHMEISRLINQQKLPLKPHGDKIAAKMNNTKQEKLLMSKADQPIGALPQPTSTFFGKAQLEPVRIQVNPTGIQLGAARIQMDPSHVQLLKMGVANNLGANMQTSPMGFSVNTGTSPMVSNLHYKLASVPSVMNTMSIASIPVHNPGIIQAATNNDSNTAILNILQKLQANQALQSGMALPTAQIRNNLSHLEVINVQNNDTSQKTVIRSNGVQASDVKQYKPGLSRTHKNWNRRAPNNTTGVYFIVFCFSPAVCYFMQGPDDCGAT